MHRSMSRSRTWGLRLLVVVQTMLLLSSLFAPIPVAAADPTRARGVPGADRARRDPGSHAGARPDGGAGPHRGAGPGSDRGARPHGSARSDARP